MAGDGIYIPIEVIDQFSRALRDFEGKMRRAAAQGGRSLDKIGKEADKTNRKTKALWATIKKETRATTAALGQWARRGAMALTAFAAAGIYAASNFAERMGNVATILSDTSVLDRYRDAVLGMAREGLGAATELADGLYQTISAGVTEPAEALEFLGRAAMAAKVGLASTFESVDLGTTLLNAFGYASSEAGRVFDEVQVAIREGKTTFAQLAASVGQAAPAFATAGLSSGELLAALATLTKGGIDTASAATYLKNTVLQLINPAREAATLMDSLGIEYGATAFQARGLAGVLAQIQEKTEGNADALVRIVPNIRAFMAVASLAGTQSEEFTRILDAMKIALGELGIRWEDVIEREDFALGRLKDSLQAAVIEGFEPALEALAEWINQGDNLQQLTGSIQALAEATGALFRFVIEYGPQLVTIIGAIFALRVVAWLHGLNAALATTGAVGKTAAAGITAVQYALGGLGAFLVGWNIGDLIRKNFIDPIWRAPYEELRDEKFLGAFYDQLRNILSALEEGSTEMTASLRGTLSGLRDQLAVAVDAMETVEDRMRALRRRISEHGLFPGSTEQLRALGISAGNAQEALNKLTAGVEALDSRGDGLRQELRNLNRTLQATKNIAKAAAAGVSDFFSRLTRGASAGVAALSAWDAALERNAEALEKLKSKEEELFDAAVRLHREIEINGTENIQQFAERILELRDDMEQWGVEIPRVVTELARLVEVTENLKAPVLQAREELDKYTTEARKATEASLLLTQKVGDLGKAFDGLKGGRVSAPRLQLDQAAQSFFSKMSTGVTDAFTDGFDRALHNIGDIWKAFAIGLGDALSQALTNALGSSFWSKILGSIGGALVGKIGSWISSLFGGASSEELAAKYGKQVAAAFGIAFTAELQAAMMRAGEQLPKIGGKIDAFVAGFMPEVLSHVLGQIDELTRQFQDKLAFNIRSGVGLLRQALGIGLEEAMGKYSGIFDDVISRAIEAGHGLSSAMADLIREAAGLGYELSGVTDQLSAAMNALIEAGSASEESLAHLVLIAKQLGLSMEQAFGDVLERAQHQLADLQRQFADGMWAVDYFLRKFSLIDQKAAFKEGFISDQVRAAMVEWERANQVWLSKLSPEERKDVTATKEQEERAEAQKDYNRLLGIAKGINIDGKHDIRDIRQGIKGLSQDEAEVVLQLVQQRLEMQQHKASLKAQKKAHRDIRNLIEAQEELMQTLSNLFGMSIEDLNKLAGAADSFADHIGRARRDWEWMYRHPLAFAGGSIGGGVSAQHGMDTVFTGSPSGYRVPMEFHGRERVQVTPLRGGTAEEPREPLVVNLTTYSMDPTAWDNYMRYEGGAEKLRECLFKIGALDPLR